MFGTLNKDNTTTTLKIKGARAHNNIDDTSAVLFQNYDEDTHSTFNMASIGAIDAYGNSNENGIGELTFKVNKTGESLSEVARFNHTGYFGIGTSNPKECLDVQGNAVIAGTTHCPLMICQGFMVGEGGIATSIQTSYRIPYYSEITGVNSMSSGNEWVTKLGLDAVNLVSGQYRLEVGWQGIQQSNAGATIQVRCLHNGSELLAGDYSIPVTYAHHSMFCVRMLPDGLHQFELQYRPTDSNNVGMRDAKILLHPL